MRDMGHPRALIFDYDGLMVDSERMAAEAVLEYLAGHGVEIDPETIGHLFGGTGEDIDALWTTFLAAALAEGTDLAAVGAELEARIMAAGRDTPLLPGVAALIEAARAAGWRIGVATGRERHRLEPELVQHGLFDRFDAIVTAEDVLRGKPAPDIYLEVAARLGVMPADCVALEDSLHGAEAALAAGMAVVVCPSGPTLSCVFPAAARRVNSLVEVLLAEL
jgi:HAD superfamily hydrolase (TIGR01509 family)